MKFSINASKLKLAATCMANNDLRYYLNGVLVTPREEGGVYLVATDGHRLMAVLDTTGSIDKERIIRFPKSFVAKLPKIGSSQETATVTNDRIELKHALFLTSEKGEIIHAHIATEDIIVDGQFPDWRRVIKMDPESVVRPGPINMRYLATALPAFASQTVGVGVRLYSMSDADCTCVRFDRHDYAVMVVMPMRDDRGDASWLKQWANISPAPAPVPKPVADPAIAQGLTIAFIALAALDARGMVVSS